MKKLIYTIAILAAGILTGGCTGFLDESNVNRINSNTYYETEDDIRMAATGAYAALRGNGYYRNMYLYTEVRSDNTTLQEPGASNGVPYQFENYTLTTDNPNIKTHWADLYKCITRANIVLDQIGGVDFALDSEKESIRAEMRFLRALTYYHLVVQFGDVPIVTRELKTKDEIWAHTKRDPKEQVYQLILDDLDAVVKSPLPLLQPLDGVGRASKVAGYALMGKVALTRAADPDLASLRSQSLTLAKESLSSAWAAKPFTTLSEIPYADLFDKDTQTACKEHIFQVMYKGGNSDLSSDFAWMYQPSSQTGLTSMRSGYGQNIVTDDMAAAYAATGDVRKAISFGTSGTVKYVRKYIDLDSSLGYGENNWPVLRYADVALMLAEVKYHLSETDAVTYLDYVRTRAGLTAYSGSDLRGAIADERRLELAFENQRWYDLLRLYSQAELLTMLQAKNPNFGPKDFLLPIPYDENKLDPERMYQNPYYK